MKILKTTASLVIIIIAFTSCKSDKKEQLSEINQIETKTDNFIDVVAKDFTFTFADTIPSGWSIFKMKNVGLMEHFFFLTMLPDTITFDNYVNQVGMAFSKSWNAYKDGQVDKNGAYGILGSNLPAWYANAKAMGGIGIISGGQTGITTIKLTAGNYVMECYIKAANGQFHSELGMINPITVSNEATKMSPPKANIDILLYNDSLSVNGDFVSGKNVIAVHFKEHPTVGLGNDIHLIKVDENTNMDDVTFWMDWLNIGGLTSPGPVVFLGGAHEMPVGYTAYFNCNLESGNYAFVAETPIGRFKTFIVK